MSNLSERKRSAALPSLPPRARGAHKGDLGRCLVIGGSPGMPGAPFLAAQGAMRAGAGLVTIASGETLLPVLGAKVVTQTLAALPATVAGTVAARAVEPALALARSFDAVALGPGLTTDGETSRFVRELVPRLDRPLVLDADGLNAFAARADDLAGRGAPTVMTPHPGEMARLLNTTVADVERDREGAARGLATRLGAVVLLKGARTVVTDGARTRINTSGNPGMATGGSGDVLSGVIAALLARGLGAFDAAALGAHVHGRAGDLAARERGEDGLVATDLLETLPRAMRERVRRR